MIRGIVRSVSAQGQVVFEQTDPPTPGTVVTHHYEPPTVEGEILGGDEVELSLRKTQSVTELIDRGTELLLASRYYEDFEGDAKAVVTTIVTGLALAQGQR